MKRMLAFLLMMAACPVWGQDGQLVQARQDVRSPRTDSSSSPTSSSSSSSTLDAEETELIGKLFLIALATPFYVPYSATGDDYSNHAVFLSYPYAEKWDGIMQMEPELMKDGKTPDTWSRLMSLRVAAENGNDFTGLNRVGLVFLADTMTRFGIGGSVNFYEEKRDNLPPDQLTIGDVNVLFRFAQSQHWQWRTGLGLRWMHDHTQTDYGFNFVYGFEWFPHDPITVGMQLEAGTLGNTGVIHFTSRVGLVWKHAEAYVGYDYLQIGGTELHGPMVGLRLWY
jgi:hypothetical protein